MDRLWDRLKRIDAFPKVREEEFLRRTLSGGLITVVASILMLTLFLTELKLYLVSQRSQELAVDTSRGEQLRIFLDITFPRMPCSWTGLDVMDVSGELHLDIDHDLYKVRLDRNGKQIREDKTQIGPESPPPLLDPKHAPKNATCGSCYGAEFSTDECCNTCESVRDAYRRRGWALLDPLNVAQCINDKHTAELRQQQGEGCRFKGTLHVNKVAGNFHFAPGKSFQNGYVHMHDLSVFRPDQLFDFSHSINKLTFGDEFDGMVNPLDGVARTQLVSKDLTPDKQQGMWQYYVKVVPTSFTNVWGRDLQTNQYSVTEHWKPLPPTERAGIPGLFFFYDLSPIKVKFSERRVSFWHFVTNVCAIVGGVFTVAGLVEAFVYHVPRAIRKKMELGKMN